MSKWRRRSMFMRSKRSWWPSSRVSVIFSPSKSTVYFRCVPGLELHAAVAPRAGGDHRGRLQGADPVELEAVKAGNQALPVVRLLLVDEAHVELEGEVPVVHQRRIRPTACRDRRSRGKLLREEAYLEQLPGALHALLNFLAAARSVLEEAASSPDRPGSSGSEARQVSATRRQGRIAWSKTPSARALPALAVPR
jgi:hypothetical protein